jgi:hypothetical protein
MAGKVFAGAVCVAATAVITAGISAYGEAPRWMYADQGEPSNQVRTGADSVRSVADSILNLTRSAGRDSVMAGADTAGTGGDTLAFQGRRVHNVAFKVGERLVFDISYGFVTAGEALMAVTRIDSVRGRAAYRIEFSVNSLPSFSWIYKVEDRYLTFIDTEWLAPLRFEQHIREGSYRRDFVAEFDQVRRLAKTTEGEYPIPPFVHDIMSAFYYTRTLDLKDVQKGDSFTMYNFYKDTSHELVVRVLGRQELEVSAGTFRTVVVEPLVREGGLFKAEGRIVIWLTDDDRKLPIRVNTKVVIGSIDTELREYSGLAGPLSSRIR